MRYLLLAGVCLSVAAAFPAGARQADPRPYEAKLKTYIGCVEQESRKNAGAFGNTLESATKAQASCDGLYLEAIKTAEGSGEPVEAIRAAMESSKKAAPGFIVRDIEWLTDSAFFNAAARRIFMDNCPGSNREQADQEMQQLLTDIPRIDARYKDRALFSKTLADEEKDQKAAYFNSDGSAKPELAQACGQWSN